MAEHLRVILFYFCYAAAEPSAVSSCAAGSDSGSGSGSTYSGGVLSLT